MERRRSPRVGMRPAIALVGLLALLGLGVGLTGQYVLGVSLAAALTAGAALLAVRNPAGHRASAVNEGVTAVVADGGRRRVVVCFVHGLNSSSATWDQLVTMLELDPKIALNAELDRFEYESKLFRTRPLTRTPEYRTVAKKLATHIGEYADQIERIVFVTHSQGGLVLQYYIHDLVISGRARELARVAQIVMLACPNLGSDLLLPQRKLLGRLVPHPQEARLRPYDDDIAAVHEHVSAAIRSDAEKSDHSWPVPCLAIAGETDRVVMPRSAYGRFKDTAVVTGDHFTIIRPESTSDVRYLAVKRPIEAALPRMSVAPAWLPWVAEGSTDVLADILRALSRPGPSLVTVVAGPDFGKSSLLRLVASEVVPTVPATMLDLAVEKTWGTVGVNGGVLLIDHLDRIASGDPMSDAFEYLNSTLPNVLLAGTRLLIVAVDKGWEGTFIRAYGMSPAQVLRAAAPHATHSEFLLRPYSDQELGDVCRLAGVEVSAFEDPHLRRPGLIALSRSTGGSPVSGTRLRAVHAARWIQGGTAQLGRGARQYLWRAVGHAILRTGRSAVDPLVLTQIEGGSTYTHSQLRVEVAEPLRMEGGRVVPITPAMGDVAAAEVLVAALRSATTADIGAPMSRSVLEAVCDLTTDEADFPAEVAAALAGRGGVTGQFAGPVLGSLRARLAAQQGESIGFADCDLAGPHAERGVGSVDREVVDLVRSTMFETMTAQFDGLTRALGGIPTDRPSAVSGGSEYWSAARNWAARLPLRADAQRAIRQQLPSAGGWRFEDVLDVSVTDATTAVMAHFSESLHASCVKRIDPAHWVLADVWDGLNDGCWDQIRAGHERIVSTFTAPNQSVTVKATRCNLAGAALGSSSMAGWEFRECNLEWVDFRSCRDVQRAIFDGSNWWSSVLPPPIRYAMSRHESDPRFAEWAEEPPWVNPYWTGSWPEPLTRR